MESVARTLILLVGIVGAWLACAAVSTAEPKPLADTQAARELAERAMKRVEEGDVAGAFEILKPHWALPEHEISQLVIQSIQQRSMIQSRYGDSLGYEYLSWTAVGDSLVQFTYLEKFSNHPLVWQFSFYKPKEGWLVNSVAWSDQVQGLFR